MQSRLGPPPLALRPATPSDARLLLTWRNDPATRSESRNTGVVAEAEHADWLTASLSNPGRKLYVAELEGLPVGTVRADLNASEGSWELSWTVAPEARGKGIGKRMVALLADEISLSLTAEVKAGNMASAEIARHCGMTLQGNAAGMMRFRRPAKP